MSFEIDHPKVSLIIFSWFYALQIHLCEFQNCHHIRAYQNHIKWWIYGKSSIFWNFTGARWWRILDSERFFVGYMNIRFNNVWLLYTGTAHEPIEPWNGWLISCRANKFSEIFCITSVFKKIQAFLCRWLILPSKVDNLQILKIIFSK